MIWLVFHESLCDSGSTATGTTASYIGKRSPDRLALDFHRFLGWSVWGANPEVLEATDLFFGV